MRRAHVFVTKTVESGLLCVMLIMIALCVDGGPLIINARAKCGEIERYTWSSRSRPWQRYKVGKKSNFRMTDADHLIASSWWGQWNRDNIVPISKFDVDVIIRNM